MNEFIKEEKYIILTAVVFAVCFGFFGAAKAEYHESGTLVSQNTKSRPGLLFKWGQEP